jgi:hypothetical protein
VSCKRSGECADYLLLHYEIVSALLSDIFNHVRVTWAMPKRVVGLFTCWRGLGGSLQIALVWKMVSSCLLRCLWKEEMIEFLKNVRGWWQNLSISFSKHLPMNSYFSY